MGYAERHNGAAVDPCAGWARPAPALGWPLAPVRGAALQGPAAVPRLLDHAGGRIQAPPGELRIGESMQDCRMRVQNCFPRVHRVSLLTWQARGR